MTKKLLSLGIIVLMVGTLFYTFFRSASSVYFMPQSFNVNIDSLWTLGAIGQQLPTFIHVIAFSLLTAAFMNTSRNKLWLVCLSWVLVDVIFEIAQHSSISIVINQYFPAWLLEYPVLENVPAYFKNGTFDPLDLLSIVIGGLIAYVILDRLYLSQEETVSTSAT